MKNLKRVLFINLKNNNFESILKFEDTIMICDLIGIIKDLIN